MSIPATAVIVSTAGRTPAAASSDLASGTEPRGDPSPIRLRVALFKDEGTEFFRERRPALIARGNGPNAAVPAEKGRPSCRRERSSLPCPRRIVLSFEQDSGKTETHSLNQLSGGRRIVLAVAGDLARRMAHGNPHLTDPLASEAIVLIDEIELHLHPSWQQRILTRTFPNTQFIVSTRSPQVLTTLHSEQVVKLRREDGRIVAERAAEPTFGAEAGDVLNVVMGVDERPPTQDG